VIVYIMGKLRAKEIAHKLHTLWSTPAQTLSDVGMLLLRIWRRSVRCRVRQIYYITSVCSTCVSCDKPPFGNLSEYQILEGFQCHNRNRCTIVLLRLHHFTLLVDQTTIDQVTYCIFFCCFILSN
jgi:hypothetical protein